jgi:hypothetical protein
MYVIFNAQESIKTVQLISIHPKSVLGTLLSSSKKKQKKPTWDHSTMEEDTAMEER